MTRILTALVGIPLIVGGIWMGDWVFAALITVIALEGQREVFELFRHEGQRAGNLLAFLAGMAVVMTPVWPPGLWLALPLGIGSVIWFLFRAPGGQSLVTLGGSVFGLVYPPLFLAALVLIRMPGSPVAWDPLVVTLGIVILMWTGDTAAYYAGRSLGRHKLAPSLSPKKTWEGVAGGVAGCGAMAVAFSVWWDGGLSLVDWSVLAAIVSMVGPAGDLFESALKRAAGTKDSASILPGHGGVLDRFDALIFGAPLAAAYLFTIA